MFFHKVFKRKRLTLTMFDNAYFWLTSVIVDLDLEFEYDL